MAKILLIEDDMALAGLVKISLESKLHEVDHVADGKQGLSLLKHEAYAAAIVDWQLPGLSGVEICQEFRNQGGTTPLIMLTAKKETTDIVSGLESGADDYLTKPFTMLELHARLKSVLRRAPNLAVNRVALNGMELDLDGGSLQIGAETIKLTRKELGILELLMRNPDRLFSAEAIVERVWSSHTDSGPETVRTHINKLRKTLAKVSPLGEDLIESVYGQGYRIKSSKEKK